MGAEIQDLISKQAEDQAKFLLQFLDKAEEGYKNLSKSMGTAAKAQVKNLDASIKLDGQFKNGSLKRKQLIAANKESFRVNQSIVNTQAKLNKAYTVENQILAKKRAALNKTNKELRENAKRALEVNERSKAGVKDAARLTGAYDKLSRELREQKKLAKDLAVTYGESSQEYLAVQKEVTALDQRLKTLDGGLGDHQRKVGQYENALNELGNRYPILGVGIAAFNKKLESSGKISVAVSAGFKALARNIKTLGIIGLIAAAAGAVLKFVQLKKSIDENREAVANLTGETGKAADVITSKVSAIANTYEKDFNEVLRSANTLAQELGITVPEALDAIGDGFATGADANGEFLEKLKEYPSQFSAAGLSARESIAIISQEVKSGVYSDKGVDAIKEATIRIREMTPATKEAIDAIGLSSDELEKKLREGSISYFDAIQMVSNQLGKLPPQSTEVGQALADIFGGPGEDAGLNYITLLGDINTDLDQLKANSNDYQKTQEKIRESNERISLTFNKLFGSSNNFFQSVKANALDFIANFLEKAIKGGVGLINFFIDLYNEATLFRGAIELTKANFATFINLVSLGIRNTIDGFKNFGKIMKAIFTGDFKSIGGIVQESFQSIKDNAKEFAAETAKEYSTAYKNTLSKEKVAFIDLDSPATVESAKKAGEKAGKAFNEGLGSQKTDSSGGGGETKAAGEPDFKKIEDAYASHFDKVFSDTIKNNEELNAARLAANIAALKRENAAFENLQKVRLATGQITQEEYAKILFDNEKAQINEQLKNLQTVVDASEVSELKKLELKKQISEKKIQLNNLVTQDEIRSAQTTADKLAQIEENKKARTTALVQGTANVLNEINNGQNERKQEEYDRELERATTAADQQTELLQRQKEAGLITEEQFARKKQQIDDRLAKKEKETKIKKFKADKKAALIRVAIDTALAAVKQIAAVPLPIGAPLLAAVLITGAVQAGIIAAQPIPKFATGTMSSPEGPAMVGEAGREILQYPSGAVALADKPIITHLPKGTRVFNNADTEKMLSAGERAPQDYGIELLRGDIQNLNSTIKNKKETHFDFRRGRITDKEGEYWTTYYNRMINAE